MRVTHRERHREDHPDHIDRGADSPEGWLYAPQILPAPGVRGTPARADLSVVFSGRLLVTALSSYRVGETLAREAILVSTVLSVPVLVVVAALLG